MHVSRRHACDAAATCAASKSVKSVVMAAERNREDKVSSGEGAPTRLNPTERTSSILNEVIIPARRNSDWIAKNFRFHTGEVVPELRINYTSLGAQTGQPVLLLHGTSGSAQSLMTPAFAGELFGAGGPLDSTRYHIIVPDALGHGRSAKPSDGMRTSFPQYNYDDMVEAQYRLVTEGLGIKHLRLVIGNSMGGMHAWIWATKYPAMMDAVVPMASQPTPMSARNWMMRRMLVETIRADPGYMDGNYTSPPNIVKYAYAMFSIATAGGTLAYQMQAPTAVEADGLVDEILRTPLAVDANDFVYQWGASRNFNASAGLERIEAAVLAVNAADDERNPPETGLMETAIGRIAQARLLLIPASDETRGHSTTGNARVFKEQLASFLESAPYRL